MIDASVWGTAAGSAPQYGPLPSPRQHRYAPIPTPDIEPWRLDALCSQSDPDRWFPAKGEASKQAQEICRRCPSMAACLEYALDNEIRWGVWGATNQNQREKLIKARKKAALQERLHGGEA